MVALGEAITAAYFDYSGDAKDDSFFTGDRVVLECRLGVFYVVGFAQVGRLLEVKGLIERVLECDNSPANALNNLVCKKRNYFSLSFGVFLNSLLVPEKVSLNIFPTLLRSLMMRRKDLAVVIQAL